MPATAQSAARYQGLGGGPNVAAMVLAVALPLAAHLAVEARSLRGRLLAGGAAALLLGSIVASGSRGALAAAFAGLAAYAALVPAAPRTRALALGAVALLFAASALATRIPQPDPTVAALPGTTLPDPPIPARGDYFDANVLWRLQEDVGRTPWGVPAEETGRDLLGGSGRVEAWEGAARLAAERPVLGHAFGLEGHVFVDRYFAHGSNLPENSYVGMFLQLGALGLLLFLALAGVLLLEGVRAARRAAPALRGLAAAAAGGLVAGLVLALTQSYLYVAGSNATMAVWLCAFLLPAIAATAGATRV
jgi:O-antigen ligase